MNLGNFTQWMSNGTSSIFPPGLVDNNESATPENYTTDVYYYNEEQFEYLLDVARSRHVKTIYGSKFYTIFIVSLVVCLLGYITNILNVVVLAKTPMCNSINLFLLSLAISDIIQITTQVSHIVHYLTGYKMFPYYKWVVFYIANTFIENIFMYISNWLVAVIGMWRCVVITWPLQVRDVCSPRCAKVAIASIVFLSFLFSTPILYMFSYERHDLQGRDIYDKVYSEIALDQDGLVLKLFWGLQQLKGLVPMSIMVAATVWLVIILNRIRKHRIKILQKETCSSANQRITLMLTILLVLYWLSNIPDCFMFLIQLTAPELQEDYRNRTDIIRIFVLTNSSISFFIYYGLGTDFRNKFHHIFLRRIVHRRKKNISEGFSESCTVRSKSFDVGTLRKASGDINTDSRELNQVYAVKEITL